MLLSPHPLLLLQIALLTTFYKSEVVR